MIEACGLHARVGRRALLQDVAFAALPGELLAIVGPNGAGKSTLLGALAGDRALEAGAVLLDGVRLASLRLRERSMRMAVLPQESVLELPFSVLEVVLLGRYPHVRGRESAHDHAIAREALAAFDAAHLARRSFPTLSGGEKQRVQMARVLAQVFEAAHSGSRVLLLDEPVSAQDLGRQHAVLERLRAVARGGVVVIATLHDLNLAAQYADRVLVLDAGRVAALGTPRVALRRETIREVFAVDVEVRTRPADGAPHFVALRATARGSPPVSPLLNFRSLDPLN